MTNNDLQIYFVIVRNGTQYSPRIAGTFTNEEQAIGLAWEMKDQVLEGGDIIVAKATDIILGSIEPIPKERIILS